MANRQCGKLLFCVAPPEAGPTMESVGTLGHDDVGDRHSLEEVVNMALIWWDGPEWFRQRGVLRQGGEERPLPNPLEAETVSEKDHGLQIVLGDEVLLIPWGRVVAVRR